MLADTHFSKTISVPDLLGNQQVSDLSAPAMLA